MARNTPIPRLDLPPSIDPPEVRKAAKSYTDLRESHRLAKQDATEAEHRLVRARAGPPGPRRRAPPGQGRSRSQGDREGGTRPGREAADR